MKEEKSLSNKPIIMPLPPCILESKFKLNIHFFPLHLHRYPVCLIRSNMANVSHSLITTELIEA